MTWKEIREWINATVEDTEEILYIDIGADGPGRVSRDPAGTMIECGR